MSRWSLLRLRPRASRRYDGEFLHGVRHGAGTFFYADGSRYCGQWEANVKCGYGVYTHVDGGVSEGLYRQDRLVGC